VWNIIIIIITITEAATGSQIMPLERVPFVRCTLVTSIRTPGFLEYGAIFSAGFTVRL
jgi:hypothetical protein